MGVPVARGRKGDPELIDMSELVGGSLGGRSRTGSGRELVWVCGRDGVEALLPFVRALLGDTELIDMSDPDPGTSISRVGTAGGRGVDPSCPSSRSSTSTSVAEVAGACSSSSTASTDGVRMAAGAGKERTTSVTSSSSSSSSSGTGAAAEVDAPSDSARTGLTIASVGRVWLASRPSSSSRTSLPLPFPITCTPTCAITLCLSTGELATATTAGFFARGVLAVELEGAGDELVMPRGLKKSARDLCRVGFLSLLGGALALSTGGELGVRVRREGGRTKA